MVSSGENIYKYFIGYKEDDHKITPLRIKLPTPSDYVKSYDEETKWMYFFTENDALLKAYNGIWNRVNNCIKKELDCEIIYNKNF